MYRIKTKFGYYYRQADRYGRFNGDRLKAEVFCDVCADDIVDRMTQAVPEAELEKEQFKGHVRCAGCAKCDHAPQDLEYQHNAYFRDYYKCRMCGAEVSWPEHRFGGYVGFP